MAFSAVGRSHAPSHNTHKAVKIPKIGRARRDSCRVPFFKFRISNFDSPGLRFTEHLSNLTYQTGTYQTRTYQTGIDTIRGLLYRFAQRGPKRNSATRIRWVACTPHLPKVLQEFA